MDILLSGQIVQILPLQQGVSQKTGNPWMTAQYIIEHEGGQYPRRMVFDVKGQQRIQEMNLQVGEQVMLHLNIDCREYQGKYYNSVEAWKVERPGQQMQQGYQQPVQGYAPQQGYQQMPPQQSPFPPQQPMAQGQQIQSPFPPQQTQVQQPAPGAAPFPPQQPVAQQAPQNNGLPFQ